MKKAHGEEEERTTKNKSARRRRRAHGRNIAGFRAQIAGTQELHSTDATIQKICKAS